MKMTKNPQQAALERAQAARRKQVQKERRSFLDMLGKAGVASSVLRASSLLGGVMAARYAAAAGEKKRVVYCYIHSGAPRGQWMPNGASAMNTSSVHYGPDGYNVAGICQFRGVDTEAAGHSGARQALGNPNYGTTVDTEIASILGATSPYSSIFLGSNATGSGNGDNLIISSGGQPKDDPRQALGDYFQSAPPSTGDSDTYKKSFAMQYEAISTIKNKLSAEEHQRLDAHSNALSKIENRIESLANNEGPDLEACSPNVPGNYDDSTNRTMVEHAKIQADILVAALKCGLTNVGVLQVGNHNGGGWSMRTPNGPVDGHGAAHSAPAGTFEQMMTEKMEVPAYFIRRLMDELDSDGEPLIQSTAFVQVTCMGDGISHNSSEAPYLLATQMPGFRSSFSAKQTSGTARDFHAAVAEGLGIPASELTLGGASGGGMDLS